jgi:hypothetical protein
MGPACSHGTRSCCARVPCTRSLVTTLIVPPSVAPALYQARRSHARARPSTLRCTTTACRPPACSRSTRATRLLASCPATRRRRRPQGFAAHVRRARARAAWPASARAVRGSAWASTSPFPVLAHVSHAPVAYTPAPRTPRVPRPDPDAQASDSPHCVCLHRARSAPPRGRLRHTRVVRAWAVPDAGVNATRHGRRLTRCGYTAPVLRPRRHCARRRPPPLLHAALDRRGDLHCSAGACAGAQAGATHARQT